MERLKSMKETLMGCVQGELCHLDTVDAKELGEAVDMIKDLSEAIYYCTITEAMEGKEHEKERHYVHYTEPYYPYRDMDRPYGRMYYDGRSGGSHSGSNTSNSGSNGNGSNGNAYYTEREYPIEMRDYREGRSPRSRRMYMEAKELHHGKEAKMKELEQYMQELTHDITEMIEDASTEEKQMLYKKMSTLAAKLNNV